MLIEFGTKAETLERLRPHLTGATVLPLVVFSIGEWRKDSTALVARVQSNFPSGKLIVRSSALAEDNLQFSNAGHFDSVGGVDANNSAAIKNAADTVIASFGSDATDANQFFIQPFLTDIAISGVVFTRDLDTLSPYYIVNYDDQSRSADSVTSGRSNKLKILVKFRNQPTSYSKFAKLFEVISQVEHIFQSDCLDIEFAIDSSGTVFILQVRPIAKQGRSLPKVFQVGHYLYKIFMKTDHLNKRHPYLYGNKTLLGVMPDWNPAEMIGVKPRPLALSLYEELITDKTWSVARAQYGYKDVRSYPLMVALINQPYIDVRVSFNSFIPATLDDEISERLANYYLSRLAQNPSSHDKVEFDILLSCYFFGMDDKLNELKSSGFTDHEAHRIKAALLDLTNQIIAPPDGHGVFEQDLASIEILKQRQKRVLDSSMIPLEKIYWLIEDCKRYGTRPFAGIARAGFIAVQILKSLPSAGVISKEDVDRFMGSITTVSKQMASDHGRLSKDQFLAEYGHLRPGTYDILSTCYADGYETYFSSQAGRSNPPTEETFEFEPAILKKIDHLLKTEGLGTDASNLFRFIREAIEAREYSKFIFTRSVSALLRLVKQLADFYEISWEDASFINVKTLHRLYAALDHRDLSVILAEEIAQNKEFYEITKLLRLPPLITDPKDVFEFELEEGQPNFVTMGRCQADVIGENEILENNLTGRIVFIPSADPGYDWIFTKSIAGLVTMYGGANSHMAIRSAELRIPAVIGAGEVNYHNWLKAKVLEIDCLNKQVRIIR